MAENYELDIEDIQLLLDALDEFDPEPGINMGVVLGRILSSDNSQEAQRAVEELKEKAESAAQSKRESIILLQAKLVRLKSRLIALSAGEFLKRP